MATIKDIASEADVSIATVSKVLNNYSDISPKTRKKVMEIVREKNFRPNANARSLIMNKSFSIGVFFKDHQNSGLRHPFFRDVIYGLERIFCDFGYDLVLFSAKWGDEYRYVEKCNYRQVDGAILMGMPPDDKYLDALLETDIPSVFVDLDATGENATYVMSDNLEGASRAVEYLYELGHRKIGMIMGEKIARPAQERLLGYQKTLVDLGLTYKSEWVIEGEFSESGGFKSMKQILELEEKPTAIFCQGDEIALGAINAIKNKGLNVPDDFSIIGFDDIDLSRYIEPKLTTIQQDKYKMGTEAAELLLKMINESEEKFDPVILPTKLIERESCRRI